MGLDIIAYSKLEPTESGKVPGVTTVLSKDDITTRADGLESGRYTFDKSVSFRAGSYSGYNQWRDWLAKLSGWKSAEACWGVTHSKGPFYELINFSDCSGVIGPATSKKLAKDFADYENKVPRADAHFHDLYLKWKEAFELAADDGAIVFC